MLLYTLFVPLIEEHPQSELARSGQIGPAITIQINYAVLPAKGNAFARRGDSVPSEFRRLPVPTVVINGGRIAGSRIAPVMSPDALAGDQFLLAIAVQISQRQRMRLRP